MAGLLDFNDPNALNTLGLIGGLLSARKGDNWPLMLQQAAMRQEAIRRGQVDEEMRRQQMEAQRLQMEQAKRAAAQQERADALLSQFQTPGVQPATRVDDNGNPMPASTSGFDFGGYAKALAGVDPARSLALQAQLSQMGARERVKLGKDERLVDPNTGGVLASGIQSAPKLSYHDLGGYVSVRDEAGKEVGRLPKTEAPGAGAKLSYHDLGGYISVRDARGKEIERIQKTEGPGKGQASEAELVAAGYGQRMAKAEALVNQIGESGHPTAWTMAAANTPLLNPANKRAVERVSMTPQQQMYRQAQEDWVRAKLRKESGAVIAEDEMRREIETYFPQPGDSPEVIAQKAQSRAVAINAMSTAAGRASGRMSPNDGWGMRKLP